MGGKGSKAGETGADATSSSTAAPGSGPAVNSVVLNVYDPTTSSLSVGVYHSGLVVYDTEFTYGGGAGGGTGIHSHRPTKLGQAEWRFRESLQLGSTDLSREQIRALVAELKNSPDWRASDYNLTLKNCNHFTTAFAAKLGLAVPSWVNRAARVGGALGLGPGKQSGAVDLEGNPLKESDRAALVLEAAPQDVCLDALIDLPHVGCLGHKPSTSLASILPVDAKGARVKLKPDACLVSDSDEQLLLFLPFVRGLRLISMLLRLSSKDVAANPKTLRFYLNQRNLNFSDVDGFTPVQSIELPMQPAGRAFTPAELKEGVYEAVVTFAPPPKWTGVSFLTILVADNHGAPQTRLHGLTIVGREK